MALLNQRLEKALDDLWTKYHQRLTTKPDTLLTEPHTLQIRQVKNETVVFSVVVPNWHDQTVVAAICETWMAAWKFATEASLK